MVKRAPKKRAISYQSLEAIFRDKRNRIGFLAARLPFCCLDNCGSQTEDLPSLARHLSVQPCARQVAHKARSLSIEADRRPHDQEDLTYWILTAKESSDKRTSPTSACNQWAATMGTMFCCL